MTPPPRGGGALPREVRLIGGQWKRRKLPVADRPGLRPTPDRVRETLFNWLGQHLGGWTCLDAFAGSGALGFEAASRGAASVVLLERDPALARSLDAQRERLGATMVRIERADALAWMQRQPPAGFDLIFLDPPFDAGLSGAALAQARPLLRPSGLLYLETGQAESPEALAAAGWSLRRHLRAGAVHAHLLAPDATARPSLAGEGPGPGRGLHSAAGREQAGPPAAARSDDPR